MIEALDRLPRCSRVAGLAGPPKLPFVRISRCVATRAVLWAPAEIVAAMAPRALHALVRAGEDKIGQRVIEGRGVERDQPVIPSLVIAVAAFAATAAGWTKPAVKLRAAGHIAGHALVA